ncbi:hypothetical protein [Actinomadura sp. KC06]|uniref:hypothetical protein n=1 Tax=Actinomadura sp. KC06 TaxID=2530369 RepID=UPI0014054469|nr:hypothetical protein [Actinomadura sp. KC06]
MGLPRANLVLVRSPSAAVGVGSSTCDSGGRHPGEARRPGVPVSLALGVGSSVVTAVRRSAPPWPRVPGPLVSEVRGVGNRLAGGGRVGGGGEVEAAVAGAHRAEA